MRRLHRFKCRSDHAELPRLPSWPATCSVISGRLDFTTDLVNVLKEGADKLTLADMNEESANMLALQTRQNLGVTSLSLASQAAQSVLRLFG
jgi:flagellin